MEHDSERKETALAAQYLTGIRNAGKSSRAGGKRKNAAAAVRDAGVTVLILAMAVSVCYVLSHAFDDNNPFASSVFILAVALISLFTTGYAYGAAASLIGVFCVNYMFTYPFWQFDMAISGYPLTFFVMLVVSILISTLTTRLKRQEALRHEAEREKLRADLLRSISHDIRTPLASILGSSSVLMNDTALSDAERRVLAAEINRGAGWLVQMTENILSVTRLSGDVQMVKNEEAMEEVVGSAIGRFRKLHAELPVRVTKPDELLFVPMNAGLIEQVLFNLLQNVALHAEGATEIVIALCVDGNDAVCEVGDDGGGIPEEKLPTLFDGRLHKDDGRSGNGCGMGIGLAVCRAIVVAHGGTITAKNNASGGATVRFTLPMKEE